MMKFLLCFVGLLALIEGRVLNDLSSKIINGENAAEGEFPYQVSLQIRKTHYCGGSIVSEFWVITSAHCVFSYKPHEIEILVGTTDLKKPYKYYQPVAIVVHDAFDPIDVYSNDISLIKVDTAFEYSEIVQPVPLPQPHALVRTNSSAVISGWGYLVNWTLTNLLQKVTVFITDPKLCNATLSTQGYYINPTHICTNDPSQKKGECDGDAGGPVTIDGVLTGIVSWYINEPECGNYPGVHTQVSEYVEWILEIISDN